MRNEYDNEAFFQQYAQMSRSREGLSAAGEWHQLKPLFPPLEGKSVLDMGCGWGAIGVLLARLCPDAQITMADINERAVALAARNARQNGVSAETLVSDGYENIAPSFDAIVTNPPIRAGKQTVYRILDEAKTRLAPGGRLFLVIRKEQGAPSAQTHLQGVYSRVEQKKKKKGYWILACE